MNAHSPPIRSYEIPELDREAGRAVAACWWPLERLGEGLEQLARAARLADRRSEPLPAPPAPPFYLADWLDWACARIGVEAEGVDTPIPEVAALLRGAGPALIQWANETRPGFLLLLGARGGQARLIGPDLRVRRCEVDALRAALCWRAEAPLTPAIEEMLRDAGVAAPRRGGVRAAILRERLAQTRLGGVWILRPAASTSFWRQLVLAGVPRRIGAVLGVFAVVYLLEIGGWGLIGKAALAGRLDFGWLAAWLLLVMTIVPWRLVGAWFEATFAIDTSRILKSRLLAGALAMDPEAVIRQGVGRLLGRVMESQALEGLALNGGMAVLVAGLELVFGAAVLAAGVAGPAHLVLLALFLAGSAGLSWRYYRGLRAWSLQRLDMTHNLIEGMVGHRTRLAQERPARRDLAEDRDLQTYLTASTAMDGASVSVLSALPSAWMVAGLVGLVPAFVGGAAPSATGMAISLGGLLVTQRAFAAMSGGLSGLARAGIAWEQVSAVFRAGRSQEALGPFVSREALGGGTSVGAALVDAHGLTFAYSQTGEPVLRGLDLTVAHGDRILLEGSSGGGKSTLAGLLTGLRTPDSGSILLNGLDRHTLGDNWRRLATAAPQFHENHILSGTLAFNLLMGRAWPASEADLAEAEALCEDLGLGDLLRRMPAGLQQRVGETGWQLSHGERSRIFLARALLQGAPLTIMDESFAALDPETLDRCLQVTLRRARALMVIAHP